MQTVDRYLAAHNLGLIQRQAGVDLEVADLVYAYARLVTDADSTLNYECDISAVTPADMDVYRSLLGENPDVDTRFLKFLASYSAMMSAKALPPIFSVADLARQLQISRPQLAWAISHQSDQYDTFELPKKHGGTRRIHSPHALLRRLQGWVAGKICGQIDAHPAAHGFVRGRSIVTNAAIHIAKQVVIRVDIKNFFPSIEHRQVRKAFQRHGYPYRVAVYLANLCTLEGKLPQGAITSPGVSNLVCDRLDRRLTGLAKSVSANYTRYADDLVFSANDPRLARIISAVETILQDEGFSLRENKTRIMRRGAQQIVTGIVVNERTSLPRVYRRRLRAAVHRLAVHGPDKIELSSRRRNSGDSLSTLLGHLGFLKKVHPSTHAALCRQLPAIAQKETKASG